MSVHAFAERPGNSYLGSTSNKRYLSRYLYIGRHKLGPRKLIEILFMATFVLLALMYKVYENIFAIIELTEDIKYAFNKLLIMFVGILYLISVFVVMVYKAIR